MENKNTWLGETKRCSQFQVV